MFSVRLVSSDSYQAPPLPQLDPTFSEFRGSEIKHVPIIRIFGTTSTGEKTCLHIHGVFPYLYVPYTGEEDPTTLAYRLAASLDAAINVSLGSATSNTQHVYLIQRVSGIPFYGYHRKEHQYLKIYFYNPAMIKRAADLLQNGSVLNQSLQPHEAHIPYLLQFMIDYNVYGMSLVNLSGVKHRRLTQTLAELTSSGQSITSENSEIEYLPSTIERQSTCEIEIDALASDIMNRREIEKGLELNPGLAAIWEEERARRAQAGLQGGDSQLVNPKSPPRPTFRPTDNDIYQEQRLARRLLTISQCDETTLSLTSTMTNQSVAYAAEVQDGENLLNSSHLPFSRPTAERSQLVESTLHATLLDNPTEVASQRMSQDCSILGTDDMPLVDLLVQLAGEGAENPESVDMDSLLGSQVSALLNDDKSDNESDDDDGVDLNLTSLQIDSLSSHEIPAEQETRASSSDEKSNPINLSPFVSSYETSISPDDEETRNVCRVPQYDGAGDVSPTLLNSDDEDNAKELNHLPEYSGNCDSASKSRKSDDLEENVKIPPNNPLEATKDSDKSDENRRSSSPVDSAPESSPPLPTIAGDAYLTQYNGLNYEPLDRLLEIGTEFAPDLEDLHSSMEIGILLSSADSDTPDSVDEALEDDAIPLETVLNGDPCFTESAELDKSDLTELQDQYVSLLGNSLLPDVHANLRIESDMGNSSNFSDSDYQTGEKPCEILLNVRSPRSSITSRESSSSSENVAPNIQEPTDAKNCSRGKLHANSEANFKKIPNDNSDHNCNVVATWAELQNLQFVEKEKMDVRLGRSKEKGSHNSQGSRQSRRRASRRSDERAASQIFRLDGEKMTNSAATIAPLQITNNCHLSPRKPAASCENQSPIKISPLSPIGAEVTIVETKFAESDVNFVEDKCPESPRVPHIAAEVEIEHTVSESTIGYENSSANPEDLFTATCGVDETENFVATVEEESPKNEMKKIVDNTKDIHEGFSYYSSQRSQRNYTNGGFEHRHCGLSVHNKIIQDEVFTSEQVWVIEKRKRGRQNKWRKKGVCSSSDCGVPIVFLTKIDVKNDQKDQKYATENSKKIAVLTDDRNIEKHPKNKKTAPTVKKILPKKRSRKSRVRRSRIESSSSDSSIDGTTLEPGADDKKMNLTIEAIGSKSRENEGESQDPESSDWAEEEGRNFVKGRFRAGEIINNPHGTRRRFSRKKRSIARNSKKFISSRATKITINGRRKISRMGKHEDLPGIPGIVPYRSSEKQGRSKKAVFSCCNGVADDDTTNEPSRKIPSKSQSVLLTNWECNREASVRRSNSIANCVENLKDSRKTAASADRRTINPPDFEFPAVSPIPKRNHGSRDASRNLSRTMSRSSTPKKIRDTSEEKVPEFETLSKMISEAKSHSTKAKLKILLETRKRSAANKLKEKATKTNNKKSASETKTETIIAQKISKIPPISVDETKKSVEKSVADESAEPSLETVTDASTASEKTHKSVDNESVDANNGIYASSTLNTENNEIIEIYESELEILKMEMREEKSTEDMSNERKDLSYQNDRFPIVEANFFSGNNYTIDAVSLEMPACLFEEDSNSVDKRSPKKVTESRKDSRNVNDTHSDVSADFRDLDVYDVESLTPCSSLANLNEASMDATEVSSITCGATEISLPENSTNSEDQKNSKSEEIHDSSFEEASPEFEALSPTPQICDLGKSLEDEFTTHSAVVIAENAENRKSSDDSVSKKTGVEKENLEFNHESKNSVEQVVMKIENESKLLCESESAIAEISPRKSVTRTEREKGLSNAAEENEQLFSRNESMRQKNVESEKVDFFAVIKKEEQSDFLESEPMDREIESKDENKEKTTCVPKKPLKCRPVSVKLVDIDLSRFDGFTPKKIKPYVESQKIVGSNEAKFLTEENILECNVIEENVENIISPEIELKERTIVEIAIDSDTESPTLIDISDEQEVLEKKPPIENSEEDETTIPLEIKSPSQNCDARTENMCKVTKLPERRSLRKFAEKAQLKLSQQPNSQPSEEESINLANSTEDSSTIEQSSAEERGEENSLESAVLTQKIADENTAPCSKCRKRSRSGKNSLGNSRDTSPEANASGEENSSGDENVKPKTHNYTNARKNQLVRLKSKSLLPLQLQMAAQKLSNASLDTKTTVQQISSEKIDQENTCSLCRRLSSQKTSESNTDAKNSKRNNARSNIEKNSEPGEEISVSESKALVSEKNLATLESSKTLKSTELALETIVKSFSDLKENLRVGRGKMTDGSELKSRKIAEDEETTRMNKPRGRGRPKKKSKLRGRKSSPKKSANDAKLNSEGFVASPQEIVQENPEGFAKSIYSTNPKILQLSASNSLPAKSIQDITAENSPALELSQNIVEESNDLKTCPKPRKRGRPRKIQKHSTEPSVVEDVIEEKILENPDENKLPEKIEENGELKTTKRYCLRKIPEPNVQKISAETSVEKNSDVTDEISENSENSEKSRLSQKKEAKTGELEKRKRGRPRKIVPVANIQKPMEESIEATEEKTCEIFEEAKLSQNHEEEKSESKNCFEAKNSEMDASKLSPIIESKLSSMKENAQRNEEKSSEDFSKNLDEDDIESKTSVDSSIQQKDNSSQYLPLLSQKTPEANDENNENEISAKSSVPNAQTPSLEESTENIKEEVSPEAEAQLKRTEENVLSEISAQVTNSKLNDKNKSSPSNLTSVETRDSEDDIFKKSDSSSSSSEEEIVESISTAVKSKKRGRSRKTRQNFAQKLSSESLSSLEESDLDNNENSQKTQLQKRSRFGRFEINEKSKIQEKSTEENVIPATPRRGRSGKATESNFNEIAETADEKTSQESKILAREIVETKSTFLPRQMEKNTESNSQNSTLIDEISEKTEILPLLCATPRKKYCSPKITRSQKTEKSDQDMAENTPQNPESSLQEIAELLETESIDAVVKARHHKNLRTIIDEWSEESASSQNSDEEDTESKTCSNIKRRGRSAKNADDTLKTSAEEKNLVAEKMTENTAESKPLARSKKRVRADLSPESKIDNSEEAKILEETHSEHNLSSKKMAEVLSETQSSSRPRKRVRFDEDSIRKCAEQLNSLESSPQENVKETSPNGRRKYSLKLNIQSSAPKRSPLTDDEDHRQKNNVADPDGINGVTEKSENTINSSDDTSFALPSLQAGLTRHRLTVRLEKSRIQAQTIQAYARREIVGRTRKIRPLTNSEQHSASVKHREPKIILKRLSRETLKAYGFEFNDKNKVFVDILKKHRPDTDYEVPAYDGAADLSSSSESEADDADVTVAREEKRVCVFQSGKKPAKEKREAIVTPRKRKLNPEDAQSPTSKHRAVATPSGSSKTPYSSPSRTSMLKSPGRLSGYYRPLKIIVTSPKVRKETSEPRDSDVRSDNRDVDPAGDCVTPRRKNVPRLHENLLRGRAAAMKSPKNDIGDERDSLAKMGSERPGELDEIESGEQREIDALNIIECSEATGNRDLTVTLRDGKDARKKLVFSTAGDERRHETTDGTPSAMIDHQSTNWRTSAESIGQLATKNDARKSLEVLDNLAKNEATTINPQPGNSRTTDWTPSAMIDHQSTNLRTLAESIGQLATKNDARKSLEVLENLAKHETTTLEPQPGNSRTSDGNLAMYDVTTDEESEDDDACDVTFTQYVDSQIEKNQATTLDRSQIGEESNEIVCLRPKFNPPSRQRILDTMETYGIPKFRNQEPFFSDEADVPKQKELAQKMLKVPGKGIKDLTAFVSSVDGVTGLARWRRMRINELQPAIAKSKEINAIRTIVGEEMVSLTPLIKPPTQKEVKKWLRAREYLEMRKKREEMTKKIKEQKNEVRGEGNEKEGEDCESNASDVSVIEASPEKIVGGNDADKMMSCTLKMKLAKRGLMKKADELQTKKLLFSEDERANDSIKISGAGEGTSVAENSSSIEMDPSLLSVLEKSRLFKGQETSRHLGVSYGQIEFLSDSTRSNVADENLQSVKALTRYQYLTIMCLEVHVATRGDLLPDAQHDSISAIFYSVQSDVPPTSNIKPLEHGVIIVADDEKSKNKMHYSHASQIPWSVLFANNEEDLLNVLVTLITRTDPEILIGWELETLSWGYVFQRATRLGMNLSKRISRIPATQCKWEAPAPDIESMADVKLPGRIVLDIWRIMRHEAALLSYTFESMMHHILNERVPCPSFKILTSWWNLARPRSSRWRVVEHYSLRVLGIFRMLDQLDIIGRTSELARLFGIQFYEVFSRGSQYRVESVMHRLAKPLNYIAVSPTPLQRASMRAMEALPLIMEPESMFYSDPLIVLDFQSLYPSIIIAHNYCFSTCLGRIEHIGQAQPFEFGAYTLRVPKSTSLKLQGKVNFAPCGVAYVKPEVRLGILPRMLTEILETRFMVKKAMKDHKQADKTLQRALHSRQLGLKLLANVTYGYTAANFSGRMPCIEVGDSVVSKSKETLERAIKLVEATPRWGARVVYGDTDSLFILVPGKSKDDAFVIGNEIADAVTAANPPPIKLKFEKVMYPSILQTKKRYCGYMYETPDQKTPTYLAKGIETVRRDGCPAVSKVLEKTLKILFETKDVSLVKKYVTRQLDKVLRGKVSIQDLTFAKEFRGLKGYKSKACVPALELTRRLMRKDPRAVPRNSERVRYVIVAGAPNQALIHCVRTPWELINDPGLRPNAIYYVTRVIIPPLNRCLNLMGVDVNAWYRDMPHRQILNNPVGQPGDKQKLTIFQYFGTIVCVSCGQPSSKGICTECLTQPADTLVVLHEKLRWLHRTHDHVTAICQSCVGQADVADCSSLDCPVLYRRAQAHRELSQATHLRGIIDCGNSLEF